MQEPTREYTVHTFVAPEARWDLVGTYHLRESAVRCFDDAAKEFLTRLSVASVAVPFARATVMYAAPAEKSRRPAAIPEPEGFR